MNDIELILFGLLLIGLIFLGYQVVHTINVIKWWIKMKLKLLKEKETIEKDHFSWHSEDIIEWDEDKYEYD